MDICNKLGKTLHPFPRHTPPAAFLFSTVEETNVFAAYHTSCFWFESHLQHLAHRHYMFHNLGLEILCSQSSLFFMPTSHWLRSKRAMGTKMVRDRLLPRISLRPQTPPSWKGVGGGGGGRWAGVWRTKFKHVRCISTVFSASLFEDF